jgi:hypothetical protein
MYSCQQSYETKIETPTSGLEYKLNGKVKSVDVYYYQVEEKFGELVKGERRSWRFKYHINEKGNLTKKETFDANDNLYGVTLYNYNSEYLISYKDLDRYGNTDYKINLEYDNAGNKIKSNHYDSENILKSFYKMSYDSFGKLIEEDRYEPDGQLLWKDKYIYDSNGNMTEHSSYHSNGDLKYKYLYEYDNKGNKTSIIRFNTKKEIELKEVYLYDKKNNLLKEMINYNSDGKISYSNIYFYNDKNDVIKIESVMDDKFEYKYDKQNNWIEKVNILGDFPETLTERIIEYY